MPRYLYLLRHAQSAEKQIGQNDRDRELTPRGVKQALLIGNFLLQKKTLPDIIMCSTAERAKSTADLVLEVLKLDAERILLRDELYEASTRTFFQFVSQLEDNLHHVICVGHNPVISYLAEYVTKAEIGEMVPAGMAIIRFNINSWKEVSEGNGELLQYIQSEMLTT
jgi:phosphohistidine phosphatase